MEQYFPGFYCWQAQYRPGREAYSVWVEDESENVLIDPFTPDEGLSRFSHPSKAIIVLLTTGNHERDAYSCKLALRAEIWAPEAALSDMDMVPDRVFSSDDELPCGIQAYHLEGLPLGRRNRSARAARPRRARDWRRAGRTPRCRVARVSIA